MSELLVYKASAGSGKTFTLAVEYIKLLVQDPLAYRRILAVTFTNKATAEMKERILSQLYGIHTADAESHAYLRRLLEETGRSEAEIRQAAGTALSHILHDYSRFRVATIDSFFQSVMRNLARELELSPNLNIELDTDKVLSEAVESLFEKLTPTSPILPGLMDYINERIAEDKVWDISGEVKSFGRNIFDEGYMEKGEGLRNRLQQTGTIPAYRKQLKALEAAVLEEMKRVSERFEEILSNHSLHPDDLKSGQKGIGSYFRKLANGKLGSDTRNATAEKCLADAENWTSKASPHRADIVALATAQLMPLLAEAETLRQKNNLLLNSCRLSLQHINKVQLLADIDEEVRTINRERNNFLLTDTNALLHRLVKDDDSSFVFEKIGANIRNVMIDEFQDTSRMQWGNFKLLLLEGLSQGADSLIVGDVKQSIYRWRNGDWGILNTLNDRLGHFPVHVKSLATNRRSETRIIRFNNLIFPAAVGYLNEVYKQQLGLECTELLKAYADVEQQSPRAEEKGYVKVSFIEPDDEHDYTQQTLIALGNEVKRLLEEGVRQNDMAILVRKKKSIPHIADYFDKELYCNIVSDEAFRLDASHAVCMLIDALRYLSDPEHSIARAQLVLSYQRTVLGNEADYNTLLLHPAEEFLPQEFLLRRAELRMMPLYELLETLFRLFDLEQLHQQDAYLFAFFDAVTEYLQDSPSDIEAFICHWDETLCSKTIPGGEVEGIRIFSIHKSKGLEFHTVLIPFCDWKLENETNDHRVWCIPQTPPFDGLDILPINYSTAMAESIYGNDYLQERLQLWVDNLNLLYVAFTRAGKNLIVWTRKEQRGTMAELLTQALPAVAQEIENESKEADVYEAGTLCLSEDVDRHSSSNRLLQQPQKLPLQMCSRQHDIAFRQSNRSAHFIQGADGENEAEGHFIYRGRLLHTLFSAIGTAADIEPAIERLVLEGVIRDREKEEMVREVAQKAFALPQVQEWYSGQWRLFNECAILYKEKGGLQTRRPDRVMVQKDRVVVVDFKFGKPHQRYGKQVKEYMQLLARMGYSNTSGYLWYVDEEKIEQVL